MASDHRYWFPAKRYGWGWGFPSAWQGWSVLIVFISLVAAGVVIFTPDRALIWFLAYVAGLSAILIAVAWLKGEPPRWRWGERDR